MNNRIEIDSNTSPDKIRRMKKANEKFFNNVIRIVSDGGDYLDPITFNHFKVISDKMISTSIEGLHWIRYQTSEEWFKSNVRMRMPFSKN